MDARQKVSELIFGFMFGRATLVAAHLGLPDLVRDGVDGVAALSDKLDIDPWRLGRFMRVLVALGLFAKTGDRFELTEAGALLCRDAPGGLRDMAVTHYYAAPAFIELERVMREHEAGYTLATGRRFFDVMAETPDLAEAFDRLMGSLYKQETAVMVETYDFGQYGSLMDVGGGNGEVLIQTLKANPGLTGHLFDLPHVVERAALRIEKAGLADRCVISGGSFFEPLPHKSPAILLRHILHDWQEDDALLILNHCREALAPGGVILIGEAIVEDADHPTLPIRLDLTMLTYFDGAERTLEEYRALASKARLELIAVTHTTPAFSIMELRVAS